ncbi:uncharacterized protein B0I36DRAFT_140238 [Microdochium trichocladiopsis]|uniref:Uncharacterized protein n=1 Tax=Microdochium trichocladiopsis TaxID=1682393 RepID=A0A9P9BNC3_9PEZI|nr:uncharacterized protein B0I36DRAFT_140238 [Microdochium trichocladiopsis]KAH7027566.1 hypothetical protein B0I36DRAFT_140238 [Microdochium trichocladiopsis]
MEQGARLQSLGKTKLVQILVIFIISTKCSTRPSSHFRPAAHITLTWRGSILTLSPLLCSLYPMLHHRTNHLDRCGCQDSLRRDYHVGADANRSHLTRSKGPTPRTSGKKHMTSPWAWGRPPAKGIDPGNSPSPLHPLRKASRSYYIATATC